MDERDEAERIVTRSDDIVVTVGVYSSVERAPGADRLVLVLRSADGSVRTNVDRAEADAYLDVFHGQGRDSEWSLTYWIWPAPADDVTVIAAWPRWRVPEGETMLTGEELRAAAAGVRQLD